MYSNIKLEQHFDCNSVGTSTSTSTGYDENNVMAIAMTKTIAMRITTEIPI